MLVVPILVMLILDGLSFEKAKLRLRKTMTELLADMEKVQAACDRIKIGCNNTLIIAQVEQIEREIPLLMKEMERYKIIITNSKQEKFSKEVKTVYLKLRVREVIFFKNLMDLIAAYNQDVAHQIKDSDRELTLQQSMHIALPYVRLYESITKTLDKIA